MSVKTAPGQMARFFGALIGVTLTAFFVFQPSLEFLFSRRGAIIVVGIVCVSALTASVKPGTQARLLFRFLAGLMALLCFAVAAVLGYQTALAPSKAPLLSVLLAVGIAVAGAALVYVVATGGGPDLSVRHGINGQRKGFVRLITIFGVPISFHWHILVAAMVVATLAGKNWLEGIYYFSAYVGLIVIHELGHVSAIKLAGLKIVNVDVSWLGGLCRFQPTLSVPSGLMIFSAGLFAQLLLFVATIASMFIWGEPTSTLGRCLFVSFTAVNLFIFLINLIPAGGGEALGNDGFLIWKILLHAFKGHPHPHALPAQGMIFPPETQLLSVLEIVPQGFVVGIEVLNDAKTPMEFVVSTISRNLAIDRDAAVEIMLAVHVHGGGACGSAKYC